jgi:hypothetical protein
MKGDVVEAHIAGHKRRLEEELAKPDLVVDFDAARLVVADQLSVVLVTSVLPVHPSTAMLSAVLATHLKLEPALEECEKFIVCDRPKLVKAGAAVRIKSGRVTPEDVARYDAYCEELERLCREGAWPWLRCVVVRMERYGGFGMSLKHGLGLLRTPYALVLQHDRILRQPIAVDDVLLTMLRRPKVRYVGLASNSSVGSEARYRTIGIQVHTGALETERLKRRLLPLPFWYDATHIASVQFYLEFVFGWHVFEGTQYAGPFRLRTGDFPEDKFGNAMLAYLKLYGMRVHPLFGSYILDDGKTEYCRHVHGRKIDSCQQRMLSNYVTEDDVTESNVDE